MENKLLVDVSSLKEEVYNNPIVKNYISLKNAIKNDVILNKIVNEMKFLKKCKMSDEEIERFNKLKEEYDNYPLIVNFKNSKEEVKIYFEEIKVELDLE